MGKEILLKVVIAICAAAWILSLILAGTVHASWGLLAPFDTVVTVAGVVAVIFDRVLWRWPGINLIVKRPDVRGTWKGEIVPNGTSANVGPIAAYVAITQTATALHVRQFTAESDSITLTAAVVDEADEAQSIVGVYRNEPQQSARDKSPIHLGALRLRVSGAEELAGDYWTDRQTRGQLALHRVSTKKAKSMTDAQKIEIEAARKKKG